LEGQALDLVVPANVDDLILLDLVLRIGVEEIDARWSTVIIVLKIREDELS